MLNSVRNSSFLFSSSSRSLTSLLQPLAITNQHHALFHTLQSSLRHNKSLGLLEQKSSTGMTVRSYGDFDDAEKSSRRRKRDDEEDASEGFQEDSSPKQLSKEERMKAKLKAKKKASGESGPRQRDLSASAKAYAQRDQDAVIEWEADQQARAMYQKIKNMKNKAFSTSSHNIINQIKQPFNFTITSDTCMLIHDDGTKLANIAVADVIKMAEEQQLDAIQITPPTAKPTVVRLVSLSKWVVDAEKKLKAKAVKAPEQKTIQLRPKIADHDLSIKQRQCLEFFTKGHSVRITTTGPKPSDEEIDTLFARFLTGVDTECMHEKRKKDDNYIVLNPVSEKKKAELKAKKELQAKQAQVQSAKPQQQSTKPTTSTTQSSPQPPKSTIHQSSKPVIAKVSVTRAVPVNVVKEKTAEEEKKTISQKA